ncbi:MAG: GntR family transcriptional regulator [Alphaproteobacteria bacterium]|nr:GntR family transcriptional regulator [Alphaproteobacteria bacterium]
MAGQDDATTTVPALLPLYAQVKARLVARIQTGDWKPGQLIPNEFALADELGVSQGTVRKALGEMTAEQLLVRRQGRGTFVQQHTPESMLFRFFNFHDAVGEPISPETLWAKARVCVAKPAERSRLRLAAGAQVVRISRVRGHGGRPFDHETIVVPHDLFPGLAETPEIPNTLYDHFQQVYAVTVTGGEEKLDAVVAGEREAGWLDVAAGSPLLRVERTMFSFDEKPVEWRLSVCAVANARYAVRLG